MKRLPKTRVLFDKLHRGVVWGCIAISVFGLVDLSYVGWKYFTNIKPQLKAEKLKATQELLDEGASINAGVQGVSS